MPQIHRVRTVSAGGSERWTLRSRDGFPAISAAPVRAAFELALPPTPLP